MCDVFLVLFLGNHLQPLVNQLNFPFIMAHALLFEDIFDVRQLNPDGKKFEKGKQFCPRLLLLSEWLVLLL